MACARSGDRRASPSRRPLIPPTPRPRLNLTVQGRANSPLAGRRNRRDQHRLSDCPGDREEPGSWGRLDTAEAIRVAALAGKRE